MKRGWIGFALLAALLVGGLFVAWSMARNHDPVSAGLEAAAEHALAGDWDQADALAQSARAEWEAHWSFSAAFADHDPMEEIDGLFAQLEVYGKFREKVAFAAACVELARQLEAMGDAHGLQWKNLL